MGKTNFQTLEELTKSVNDKVAQLANGDLLIDEIEALTEAAQELYERLIVIRYKSYENVNADVESSEIEIVVEAEQESADDSDTSSEEEMMMFDFTDEVETSPSETESDIIEETEPLIKAKSGNPKQGIGDVNEDDGSLNANFKAEDSSLGSKLNKAPITDLKSHIGINRKFLYINDLFDGDNGAYNSAIEALNAFVSKNDAFMFLEELKASQDWDIGHQSVVSFTDIVERRFSS